jgi:hypothetical protein
VYFAGELRKERQEWSFRTMRLVRILCAVAAVVLVTKSLSAEPSTVLAATDPTSHIEDTALAPATTTATTTTTEPTEAMATPLASHQARDATLSVAEVE